MKLRNAFSTLLALCLCFSLTWQAGSSFASEQIYYIPPEKFTDISEKSYWFESVQWLKENNIVLGYMDGTFQGEQSIQRAEALKIVLSLPLDFSTRESHEAINFSDVPNEAWFAAWVEQGSQLKLIEGYEDNTFRPQNSISRVEALALALKSIQALPSFEGKDWVLVLEEEAKNRHLLVPDWNGSYRLEEAITRYEFADLVYKLLQNPSQGAFEFGVASYYGYSFDGAGTASGKKLEAYGYMAAHKSLPFGTKVKVSSLDNQKFVIVEIVDRGPYVPGRIIDLTPKAFEDLASLRSGIVKVRLEVLVEVEEEETTSQ